MVEMNDEGDLKLTKTEYLRDKDVYQVLELNKEELIAFVHGDANFYVINKVSGLTENI